MKPIHNRLFDYKPIEKTDGPEGRTYLVDGVTVPSVTTILSKTKDMAGIDSWRRGIGETNADAILKEAGSIGNLMHKHLECYLINEERPQGNAPLRMIAKKLADVVIDKALSHVSEFWGSEVQLHYEDLYAGTCDLTGLYKSRPSIMDFKNSRQLKKIEHIQDYFAQVVLYGTSHNHMFGTDIKEAHIFICIRDGTYQQFDIWPEEWEKYEYQAFDRLENTTRLKKRPKPIK
jgi:hypothetical protein